MTDPLTPLDHAHAAMTDADEASRRAFYNLLAGAELFLLLGEEPEGEAITPRTFPVEDATYVLAFDLEERLADFAGPAPYAAITGRRLAALLAEQGLGLGFNLEVAPSALLLDPATMGWLAEALGTAPATAEARPTAFAPPTGLPEALLTTLDAKLATATGLARMAYLTGATYEDGTKSHLLAFIDAAPDAEAALARTVNEALTFSGVEAGTLDVAFLRASAPAAAALARAGLRFDLPQPEAPQSPAAPGMDPGRPPRL